MTILIDSILWWVTWTISPHVLISLRNPILLISQCMEMNRWLSLHFIYIPRSPNLDQYYQWIRILASSIPIKHHRWFTVNFTMLKEQELVFIWHLYEEANIFKLHTFVVKITTCLFPHIGKSTLRIKEKDYVRKIIMRRWVVQIPRHWYIELIVKPINMVNNLNMIYCNNGNG